MQIKKLVIFFQQILYVVRIIEIHFIHFIDYLAETGESMCNIRLT